MGATRYTPVEMIEKLVSFDTTSHVPNLELITFVEAYLGEHGIASTLLFNDDRSKANLIATIGPEKAPGGVVLSGHSDVVPVTGQVWSTDPFKVIERGGRLYGRGTCDMKSFLAIALALAPDFHRRALKSPIHIILTYDEETDCSGAVRLMEALPETGLSPRAAIIGEPTSMRVVNAHKGGHSFETQITGREAHSSAPHLGVNTIDVAAQLIAFLAALSEEITTMPYRLEGVEPPYSTINVGRIDGGQQYNIVPARCRFDWEIRCVPGHDIESLTARFDAHAEQLQAKMRASFAHASIETICTSASAPFTPEEDSPAETLVKSLIGSNEAGAVAFGTEAPCYQQAGISVVVFGPGSIEQAHKPDEFITLSQVDACVAFMERLANRLESAPFGA